MLAALMKYAVQEVPSSCDDSLGLVDAVLLETVSVRFILIYQLLENLQTYINTRG